MTNADQPTNLSPLKRALLAIDELQARLRAAEQSRPEPIAIIGVGCRVPGGPTPDAFWQVLREGQVPLVEVPADRWDADAFYDPDVEAPGKMVTRHGAFLDRIDLFDPQFFGIAPREAVTMDPQQRLLLEVCWEALEHAGIAPDSLSGSATGMFLGIAASDYTEVVKAGDLTRIDSHFASGVAHSIASGRIAYILGLQGPAISIDTACSSGLVSVHLACQSLLAGDCRMALAGAVNVIVTPDLGVVFSKSRMLAPDGRCKTFDAAADGFGRGEGCGVIVLKRLSHALADGDRIVALIPGSAVNQDGPSSGLTAPNGPAQEAVVRAALQRAGLTPDAIDVIEAHGTGTVLGDPIEVQALGAVFGPRKNGRRLMVGSVKTNIGHLEAAAGIAGLLKMVLALQHEAVPPHRNLERLNPLVEWDDLAIDIPTVLTPWARTARPRVAGISSFGFSGTNAHILVQEAPVVAPQAPAVDRPVHLLTVSAKTPEALRARVLTLEQSLDDAADQSLANAAFTANVGRAQFAHRLAVRATSLEDARSALRQWRDGGTRAGTQAGVWRGPDHPSVAFLFTGQGAQYAGMGRQLYETQPSFRRVLDRCQSVLDSHLDRPLLSILYPEHGDASLIDETAFTQPALFAVDYALAELWRSWGIEPAVVMGHSLGEYVAACVAGAISLEDALMLVAARGRLMQALPATGSMASVFADGEQVADAIAPYAASVSIAAFNEPSQTVISGESGAVGEILQRLAGKGIKAKRLTVSHAFHSPLMAPMLDEFTALVEKIRFSPLRVPLVSNVTGEVISSAELGTAAYWRRHILAPVRFAQSIAAIHQRGVSVFLEAGPNPTLLGLAARCIAADVAWVPSLRKGKDEWEQITDSLAQLYVRGGRVNWSGFDREYSRRKVVLPTYPFERERYWADAPRRARRASAANAGSHQKAHPLLGRRVRAPRLTETVFEARIAPDTHTWLFDHRVHGTAIVPGTAFMELGLAAAAATTPGRTAVIEDLAIHAALPLVPDGETTIQVIVGAPADGHATFQIMSVSGTDDQPVWTLHAEGRLAREANIKAGVLPATEPVKAIEERCPIAVEPGDLYQRFEDIGIQLGPAFRGLVEVRRRDGEAVAAIALPSDEGEGLYQIHPVVLDNAVQTLAAALPRPSEDAAFLPVGVDRAIVIRQPGRQSFGHAVVRTASADSVVADVFLRDSNGDVEAAIEGLRLRRAAPSQIQRDAASHGTNWLYDIRWEEQPLAAGGLPLTPAFPAVAELAAEVESRRDGTYAQHGLQIYDEALPQLELLSAAYISAAMARLGWAPTVGDVVSEHGLAEQLRIVPTQRRLFGRFLEILAEVGVLTRLGDGWRVASRPADASPDATFADLMSRYGASLGAELTMTGACGPHLAAVLAGVTDPLSLLFPDGSSDMAEALYQTSPGGRAFNQLLAQAVGTAAASAAGSRPLRILEIGGGTGATTSYVLPKLPTSGVEYVFTDVSPAFTARAARKFAAFPFVRYEPLNIEQDPATQGFAGEQFDIIIAANVLHATRDLGETFGHVRSLLAPGGLLFMLEINARLRWIDLTFGLTDGWWRFVDRDRRPSYPLLERAEWSAFLREQGFGAIATTPSSDTSGVFGIQALVIAEGPRTAQPGAAGRWLVVGDRAGSGRVLADRLAAKGAICTLVDAPGARDRVSSTARFDMPGEGYRGVVHVSALDAPPPVDLSGLRDYEAQVCGSALHVIQALAAMKTPPALTVVTRGAQAVSAEIGLAPYQATLWGVARTATLEHPELQARAIDLDSGDQALDELADELLSRTRENQVAFRGGRRYVARLAPHVAGDRPMLPATYKLATASPGTFEGLSLRPNPRRAPARGEVEIEVAATALNFADVMDALGVRPGGAAAEFGGECAGKIVAVGDGVHGLHVGDDVIALAPGCYASHVTCRAEVVVPRSARLTAEEGASIGIPFITASFALREVGQLRAGERVLIHAAAGGVGLAAVQIARQCGAEIFATAGSAEKRAYLESLGVRHVWSSRTTAFADEILERTGGRGVDVVLNSLTGDFIPASLKTVATGGRFLEIGKTGWSPAQVREVRPDLDYAVLDWWPIMRDEPARIRAIFDRILEEIESGQLDALPITTFDAAEASAAFRFMAQARQIGKIVVRHGSQPLVRPDATYLVTGGLTGLGLLVAEWLVGKGGRSLVLTGRRGASPEALETIARLRNDGAQVTVVQADAGNEADMRQVFDRIRSLPPLRGIVHSAGVLDDGSLVQQDWSRFETVMAPKVSGAWLLHRLSAGRPLDFFVLFSSMASVFGSPGQSNHAAANSFMDALAHDRRRRGLPALSINWGVWSEVGAAVRHGVDKRSIEQGLGVIDPARGLTALEQLLRERAAQTLVSPMNWNVYARHFKGGTPSFFAEVMRGVAAKPAAAAAAPATPSILRELDATPPAGRARVLQSHVRAQALAVLGLPPARTIDGRQPLNELGLDSLLAVELRNLLSAAFGRPLPATLLFDYPTIDALAGYFSREVLGSGAEPAAASAAPAAASGHVVDQIEDLSDEDVERLFAERLARRQTS